MMTRAWIEEEGGREGERGRVSTANVKEIDEEAALWVLLVNDSPCEMSLCPID